MLALLLLAAAPAVTPPTVAFPRPQTATVDTCRVAACTSLDEVKVCKCSSATSPEGDSVFVLGPGERSARWEATTYLGAVADFLAWRADLDGDDKPELIVANRAAEANGMAVRTWEVAVVDGVDGVLHFRSQDFGPDAIAKGSLLVTEWESRPAEKGAEPAMFFVGREYAYKEGRLVPSKEPVRRRRFGKDFEAERLAALNANDLAACSPRRWLAHASAARVNEDAPGLHRGGVIRGVTRDEGELELHLERDDGELETLSSDGEVGALLRLADARSHRLFPPGYLPANAEQWLLGRKVIVALKGNAASGLLLLP